MTHAAARNRHGSRIRGTGKGYAKPIGLTALSAVGGKARGSASKVFME